MNDSKALNFLLATNLGLGALFLLAPKTAMRIFGVDPAENPAAAYAVRYLGARSLLLGVMLGTEESRDAVLRALPVIAATDTAANLFAAATGEVPKRTVVLGTAISAAIVGVGFKAQQD